MAHLLVMCLTAGTRCRPRPAAGACCHVPYRVDTVPPSPRCRCLLCIGRWKFAAILAALNCITKDADADADALSMHCNRRNNSSTDNNNSYDNRLTSGWIATTAATTPCGDGSEVTRPQPLDAGTPTNAPVPM